MIDVYTDENWKPLAVAFHMQSPTNKKQTDSQHYLKIPVNEILH